MDTVSPLGVKKMSWNYIVVMVAQCVKCGGSHGIVDLIMNGSGAKFYVM